MLSQKLSLTLGFILAATLFATIALFGAFAVHAQTTSSGNDTTLSADATSTDMMNTTSGTSTPGVPSTGVGSEMVTVLALTAAAAVAGFTYLRTHTESA